MKFHSRLHFAFRITLLLVLFITAQIAFAQDGYKKPPKEVLDILNAPATPNASLSPTRDNLLLLTANRYPPLADLAQPMLRLAGRRINPASNSPHRAPYSIALSLKRIADGSELKIALPPGAKINSVEWSDDGKHFAFLNTTANQVEAWVGDTATGRIQNLRGVTVNSAYGDPLAWMPDNRTLMLQVISVNARPRSGRTFSPTRTEHSGKLW